MKHIIKYVYKPGTHVKVSSNMYPDKYFVGYILEVEFNMYKMNIVQSIEGTNIPPVSSKVHVDPTRIIGVFPITTTHVLQ